VWNQRRDATQLMVYDVGTVDRCLKYAFELKKKRNAMNPKYAAKPITLIHKRNVLTHCGDLWYRAFEEMGAKQYPNSSATIITSTRQICGS